MNENDITETKFLELGDLAEAEGRRLIVMFEDADGNWRAGKKAGATPGVFVRGVGPETVLQMLLTHDGK